MQFFWWWMCAVELCHPFGAADALLFRKGTIRGQTSAATHESRWLSRLCLIPEGSVLPQHPRNHRGFGRIYGFKIQSGEALAKIVSRLTLTVWSHFRRGRLIGPFAGNRFAYLVPRCVELCPLSVQFADGFQQGRIAVGLFEGLFNRIRAAEEVFQRRGV